MSSTIKVNNIQNLAGDDSGFDLSTNDKIGMKIANSEVVTVDTTGVVFNENSADRDFRVESDANTHGLFLEGSTGNVKIGTTSDPSHGTADNHVLALSGKQNNGSGVLAFIDTAGNSDALLTGDNGTLTINVDSSNATSSSNLQFRIDNSEAMRINDNGSLLIATTSEISTGSNSGTGVTIQDNGRILVQADDAVDSSAVPLRIGRLNHDNGDTIVLFSTNGDARGSISVSGGTVSFNAFMGSHITQAVPSDTLEGTVLESTGELIDSEEEDYEGYVQQKRLTKCKVSDTEDSNNVYGVFQTEAKSGLQYASALGSFFVRVHKDETVALGDLLSSKGDGTAKVQSDDIIRSSTIGKVTSLTKKVTHSDGSFLLPCVLYCG